MEMAQDGDGGNTGPNTRTSGLRPPWKKGESGNPKGRPKSKVERLSRKVMEQHLRALLAPKGPEVVFGDAGDGETEAMPPPAPFHPLVHAAVIKEASKRAGMTEVQRMTLLLAAAKARSEFSSKEEWLDFVAAVAGHRRREELPALEEHGDERTRGQSVAGDEGGGATSGPASPDVGVDHAGRAGTAQDAPRTAGQGQAGGDGAEEPGDDD